MEQYETSPISGYWREYVEHTIPASRGNENISGSVKYGKYDIPYQSRGNGFITYDPKINKGRENAYNVIRTAVLIFVAGAATSSSAIIGIESFEAYMFGF